MNVKPSFKNINPAFSAALKKRVSDYFSSSGIKHTGNAKLHTKTMIIFLSIITIYLLLVFGLTPIWLSVILCAIFGFGLAIVGFNVMHEGGHGSYSDKRWVNSMMAYSLNLMGGNSYLWKQKHNMNHHSFTNVEGLDDDIDIKPWFRTTENQRKHWYHRYQHIYWIVLYGFTYLLWVFSKDFGKYFTGKVSQNTYMKEMKLKDHFIFWASKLLYIVIFIVIPGLMLGFLKALIGYAIASIVCGWAISIVFQLAHLVPETSFPVPNEQTQKIEEEWTIHQLATTANFSTKSKVVSWITGGLNFQIEHHLFPRVSHVHYPAISKLVKEICSQNSIKYIEYKTVFSALRSHVLYLKTMGMQ